MKKLFTPIKEDELVRGQEIVERWMKKFGLSECEAKEILVKAVKEGKLNPVGFQLPDKNEGKFTQ